MIYLTFFFKINLSSVFMMILHIDFSIMKIIILILNLVPYKYHLHMKMKIIC
jgi:hypothetical protein